MFPAIVSWIMLHSVVSIRCTPLPLLLSLFILQHQLTLHSVLAYDADGLGLSPVIREHPSSLVVKKHEPVTLTCKASGTPPPSIEWYKDNELVRETSNRIFLSNGDLFILNVMNNKKDKDTGVYHCLARNEHGKARSRNASLEMATIKDEFRVFPKNVGSSVNEVAVLECSPPRGFPEPTVSWKKNGEPVPLEDRFHMSDSNLVISSVQAQDSGQYQCVAKNLAGVRESPPAQLSVRVKPYFVRKPEDVTAILNEEAELICKVAGDPAPNVIWRRENGRAISESAMITEDKSIKISQITKDDEGVYVCEADNAVGRIAGVATLIVHSRPVFLVQPKDVKVRMNGEARFDCLASGNPRPSTFWTKEGNQNLMFPDNKYGRSTVTADGTLIISPVKREDVGYYVCSALSVVGSTTSKAHLNVSASMDTSPPPIIILGPSDRIVPEHSLVQLPCETTSTPQPSIEWTYNNEHISDGNFPTFSILPGGTLQIQDVKLTDSGEYKCIVSSQAGQSSWSAKVRVVPKHNYRRQHTYELFPDPPSRPNIVNTTEHTITLSWKPTVPVRNGSQSYVIEYYSPDLSSEWTRTAETITSDAHTVRGLKSGTRYFFLVRSRNSYGVGPPSPLSYEAKTLDVVIESHSEWNNPMEVIEARHRLEAIVVELIDVQAISSTSVRLLWNVAHGLEYIEGFYVRYRVIDDPRVFSIGSEHRYNMVTVYNGGASSYVLDQLPKFTTFEFFLLPFYKTIDGKPSNTRMVRTLEDIPTGGPSLIKIESQGVNSAMISWQPPASNQINGILRGYELYVQGTYINYNLNVTLDGDTNSYIVRNLTTETEYSIQIYAFTEVGRGPSSEPLVFILDSLLANDVYSQRSAVLFDSNYWIFVLVTSCLILLFIVFCGSILLLRRRKLLVMKGSDVPPINTAMNFKDGDFFCSPWEDKLKSNRDPTGMLSSTSSYQQRELSGAYRTSTSDEQTEYAEVSQQENNYETAYYATSSSIGGDDHAPVAYASSNIITSRANSFRPPPPPANQMSWSTQVKPSNRNNFYTLDRCSNNTKMVNAAGQPLIGHSSNDYEDASVFYDSIANVTQISPSKLMANTYRYGSLSRPSQQSSKMKHKQTESSLCDTKRELSESIMLNNKHKPELWESESKVVEDSSFNCHIISNPMPQRSLQFVNKTNR